MITTTEEKIAKFCSKDKLTSDLDGLEDYNKNKR